MADFQDDQVSFSLPNLDDMERVVTGIGFYSYSVSDRSGDDIGVGIWNDLSAVFFLGGDFSFDFGSRSVSSFPFLIFFLGGPHPRR